MLRLKGFDPPPEPLKVTIFHTNDMHGRLEAMARLSHFTRRLRAQAEDSGNKVLFWDAGDAADRRIQISSITKGAAFMTVMNAMDYQLQTMGNAIALPYGPQAIEAVAARAKFPILAANFRNGKGPLEPGVKEYVIQTLPGGFQYGVIGLTAPWGDIYQVFDLHLPDFIEVAKSLVKKIRRSGVKIVIVLSHLGLEDDRRLASEVKGIDLIIGAHSHHLLHTGEYRNGVLITQAGEYAQHLGRVDLIIDPASGQIRDCQARVLAIPVDEPSDPTVQEAIQLAEQETQQVMSQPIGRLQAALDIDHYAECGIGNLAADILRLRLNADVGMVASGQFHHGLPAGEVSVGELDKACFSSANPCLTIVSGTQITAALERGLNPEHYKHMLPSFRGTPVGIPQISGIQVWYDPNQEHGSRVKQVLVGDEPLHPDRTYSIAHTDAETMREWGYLELAENQPSDHEVPTILREAIAEYISENSPTPPPDIGRYRVSSEDEK